MAQLLSIARCGDSSQKWKSAMEPPSERLGGGENIGATHGVTGCPNHQCHGDIPALGTTLKHQWHVSRPSLPTPAAVPIWGGALQRLGPTGPNRRRKPGKNQGSPHSRQGVATHGAEGSPVLAKKSDAPESKPSNTANNLCISSLIVKRSLREQKRYREMAVRLSILKMGRQSA